MQLQLTKLVLILAMFISFQQITFAQNKKAIANTKAVTYQGIELPVDKIKYGLIEFEGSKKQSFWYLLASPFINIKRLDK
jgi:hypothetical protein